MELELANKIWEEMKVFLHEQLGDSRYTAWFPDTSVVKAEEDELVLVAKERFQADFLNRRYVNILYANTPNFFHINFRDVKVLAQEDLDAWKRRQEQMAIPKNYTFDNFIVGNSNLLAHAASMAVAEFPGTDYNPLFIYGGPGLGKTHLITAIANFALRNNKNFVIEYSNAEKFTNEVVEAIRNKKTQELRSRLRDVDMLFIDDIQFLAGRTTTQEEFFNTFNELFKNGKQIVITSDRPPDAIDKLEERMRSRYKSGIVVAIVKPDLETRIAILKSKAMNLGVYAEDDALEVLAGAIDTSIRELEGSLRKAQLIMKVRKLPTITAEIAEEALSQLVIKKEEKRIVTPEIIIKEAAKRFNVSESDILSSSRSREVAVPRQIAIYLTRELCGYSTPRIGAAFGRDHSTVMHACKKTEEMIKTSDEFAAAIRDIKNSIN